MLGLLVVYIEIQKNKNLFRLSERSHSSFELTNDRFFFLLFFFVFFLKSLLKDCLVLLLWSQDKQFIGYRYESDMLIRDKKMKKFLLTSSSSCNVTDVLNPATQNEYRCFKL